MRFLPLFLGLAAADDEIINELVPSNVAGTEKDEFINVDMNDDSILSAHARILEITFSQTGEILEECGLPRIIIWVVLRELARTHSLLNNLEQEHMRKSIGCELFRAMDDTRKRAITTSRNEKEESIKIRDVRLISQFYQWEQLVNILVSMSNNDASKQELRQLGSVLTATMKKQVCWNFCRECYPCWHDLASMIKSITKTVIFVTTPEPTTHPQPAPALDEVANIFAHANFDEWASIAYSEAILLKNPEITSQ
eukprot:Gregarina_sp_Poly_1__5476@NODE_2894_length_1572_cov_105_274419_g366_i2_p1_GENE_NODE_2894_length_1572_cov_105_274419_g366_i2NODE_2894_length_1572_cov_105_274419_g366_i2_p1_ORF_typecomplete_len254_score31_94_NODE_2894_length_1572_cov_105_274419_g366_i25271288